MLRQIIILLFLCFSFSLLTRAQTPNCSNDGPNKCETPSDSSGKGAKQNNRSAKKAANNNASNPSTANLIGEAPPPAPKADDRTFVLDVGPGLDTGCTGRGQLSIAIPISRVISRADPETDPISYQRDVMRLINNLYLSEKMVIEMPVYDVDFAAGERDEVYFNNRKLEGTLVGENQKWSMFRREVSILNARLGLFTPGDASPSDNFIVVDIDTTNAGWCTSVAWVSLSFDAMSPTVFIHGNGSNGGFLQRQRLKEGYINNSLLLDDTLSMDPASNSIDANKLKVGDHLKKVARAYGVDSLHIIAHSKGGLDSRAFLADIYKNSDQKPKIISYTSLSTPHNGSILADESVQAEQASKTHLFVLWGNNFPLFTQTAVELNNGIYGVNNGTKDLTTDKLKTFNSTNVPALSGIDTIFHTIGADADLDNDQKVCSMEPMIVRLATCNLLFPVPEDINLLSESMILRTEQVPGWMPSFGFPNVMYQNLRRVTKVESIESWREVSTVEDGVEYKSEIPVVTITGTVTNSSIQNDTLVSVPSAHGEGSFGQLVNTSNQKTYNGYMNGANHATVAALRMFSQVIVWQWDAELKIGDLKRRN